LSSLESCPSATKKQKIDHQRYQLNFLSLRLNQIFTKVTRSFKDLEGILGIPFLSFKLQSGNTEEF